MTPLEGEDDQAQPTIFITRRQAPDTFVFYLIDVSMHGAGAAAHSVNVLNLFRQRALPSVGFRNPAWSDVHHTTVPHGSALH